MIFTLTHLAVLWDEPALQAEAALGLRLHCTADRRR